MKKLKFINTLIITPVITTALLPIIASCSKENPDEVVGNIKIKQVTKAVGVKMSSDKTSFTRKEAKDGFSVSFIVEIDKIMDKFPVFVLNKISCNGKEVSTNQYKVKYSEETGFFNTSFTVLLKTAPEGDLTFDLVFNESINDIPMIEKYEGSSVFTNIRVSPTSLNMETWDGDWSVVVEETDTYIHIKAINLLYSDETDVITKMNVEPMIEKIEFFHPSFSLGGVATADITDIGHFHLSLLCAYNFVKVQLVWSE